MRASTGGLAIQAEAMEILRGQIEKITLTPGPDGTLEVLLHGDLARILQLCEAGEGKSKRPRTNVPGRELSVVAGACNTFYLLLFATTRIGWK